MKKSKFPLFRLGAKAFASRLNAKGFYTLGVAIGLSGGLLVYWAMVRDVVQDPTVVAQADNCISQLQAANTFFKAAAAQDSNNGIDPNKDELNLSDPNVVNVTQCEDALTQLTGVAAAQSLKSGATRRSGDLSSYPLLQNLVNTTLLGYGAASCSLTARAGIANYPYYYPVTATIPNQGGQTPIVGISWSNPSFSSPPTDSGSTYCAGGSLSGSTWTEPCSVDAASSKPLVGQVNTIAFAAAFPVVAGLNAAGGCDNGFQPGSLDPTTGAYSSSPASICVLIPSHKNCSVTHNQMCNQDSDCPGGETCSYAQQCVANVQGALQNNPYLNMLPELDRDSLGYNPVLNYCVETCTGTASFTWQTVQVKAFDVNPSSIDMGSTDPITFHWTISDAQSASISPDPGIGTITSRYPTGTDDSSASVSPPTQTTTYTFLALGVDGVSTDFATATLVVKQPSPVTVAITSPTPNEQVLDTGVTVTGLVVPPPAVAGTLEVQILVNGSYLSNVAVDTNGNFSVTTALLNTISLSDITLEGTAVVTLNACGPVQEPITVIATPTNGSMNGIVARVIAVAAPATTLGSASVTVEHVVSLLDFQYQWAGICPGDPVGPISTPLGGVILRANQPPEPVGSVNCGYTNNPAPVNCGGSADAAVISLSTSVGQVNAPQYWDVNVPACCGTDTTLPCTP